jgi:low affinity Fe/Cu permease
MEKLFTRLAQSISYAVGTPIAFFMAAICIVLWALSGPIFGFSDTWQLVVNTATTIITFLMVFLIQNSQNRDAAAIQAKLDELIRSIEGARNRFIGVEHLTERQVEQIRAALESENGACAKKQSTEKTVDQLLSRL